MIMERPFFDESNLPGSVWSTIVTVLRPQQHLPRPTYIGERMVEDPAYCLKRGDRRHYWSTLKICIGGCGFFQAGEQQALIKPGQAILFSTRDDLVHGIADGADQFHFCRVSFTGLNPLIEELTRGYGYLLSIPRRHSIMQRIFSMRRESRSRISMEASSAAELIWSVVASCMHLYEISMPDNNLTRACVEWINDHIESGHSIADCAAALGVSQAHLTRTVHERLGQTPGAMLQHERLRYGLYLLLNSSEQIKSIATRCGYRHAPHFSRAFRERYSVSPRDVRQNPDAWAVMA